MKFISNHKIGQLFGWWTAVLPVVLLALQLLTAEAVAQGRNRSLPIEIAMDPISVTVLDQTRVAGFLAVTFSLHPSDRDTEAAVNGRLPQLRDSVIQALSRLASENMNVTRPVNMELVRRTVQTAVDRVIGSQKAAVTLQKAEIQKL